jgi:hypothetical protein
VFAVSSKVIRIFDVMSATGDTQDEHSSQLSVSMAAKLNRFSRAAITPILILAFGCVIADNVAPALSAGIDAPS